jgi:hypothetical protein
VLLHTAAKHKQVSAFSLELSKHSAHFKQLLDAASKQLQQQDAQQVSDDAEVCITIKQQVPAGMLTAAEAVLYYIDIEDMPWDWDAWSKHTAEEQVHLAMQV